MNKIESIINSMDCDSLTIAQVANLFNVTKQTIYNQLKSKDLQQYIILTNDIKSISKEGIKLIQTRLKLNNPIELKFNTNEEKDFNKIDYNLIITEKDKRIDDLKDQLKEKDKQIDRLMTTNQTNELFKSMLEQLQEQQKEVKLLECKDEKKGFFKSFKTLFAK